MPLGAAKYNVTFNGLHSGSLPHDLILQPTYTCAGGTSQFPAPIATASQVGGNGWNTLTGTVTFPPANAAAGCRLTAAGIYMQQEGSTVCATGASVPISSSTMCRSPWHRNVRGTPERRPSFSTALTALAPIVALASLVSLVAAACGGEQANSRPRRPGAGGLWRRGLRGHAVAIRAPAATGAPQAWARRAAGGDGSGGVGGTGAGGTGGIRPTGTGVDGSTCSTGGDCMSSFCADTVCCATECAGACRVCNARPAFACRPPTIPIRAACAR